MYLLPRYAYGGIWLLLSEEECDRDRLVDARRPADSIGCRQVRVMRVSWTGDKQQSTMALNKFRNGWTWQLS